MDLTLIYQNNIVLLIILAIAVIGLLRLTISALFFNELPQSIALVSFIAALSIAGVGISSLIVPPNIVDESTLADEAQRLYGYDLISLENPEPRDDVSQNSTGLFETSDNQRIRCDIELLKTPEPKLVLFDRDTIQTEAVLICNGSEPTRR